MNSPLARRLLAGLPILAVAILATGCARQKGAEQPAVASKVVPKLDCVPPPFVVLGDNTVKIGNKKAKSFGNKELYDFAKKHRARRKALENRLNTWYRKAVRRREHLSHNNPLNLRITLADVFDDVGHPVEAFYSDETRAAFAKREKEGGELTAEETKRRREDLEFAERVLHMTVDDYVGRIVYHLDRWETAREFKRLPEAKDVR
ncbi:MAG: hypothetical protein OXN17_18855 [Candidatus Poribacteria bacterium]|nr:hypothetical protein [Candidatus Poribacteria bacterium]